MSRTKPAAAPMVARVYLRVSTDAQDLERQEGIITAAKAAGYYVAGIYREKASGARADRPELLRMVADLQPGEVVIAEKIDRISRLPLPEAERLVASIRAKGARLAVPGVVDLSDLAAEAQGVAKIVLESVQDMLLKLALQMARDDYEDRRERQRQGIELAKRDGRYKGRRADPKLRAQVIALRSIGQSIAETAKLAGCSVAQVKRIWASRDMSQAEAARHGAFVEDASTAGWTRSAPPTTPARRPTWSRARPSCPSRLFWTMKARPLICRCPRTEPKTCRKSWRASPMTSWRHGPANWPTPSGRGGANFSG